jgi:uncharacterized membrane protein
VVILHAFIALTAGFAVMALLVIAMTALLTRMVPSWTGAEGRPQPGYVFVNLGYSFLAAAAGGYVTAWVAAANPLIHVLALGLVVLALAALSALQSRGNSRSGTNWRWWRFRPSVCWRGGWRGCGCWEFCRNSHFIAVCHHDTIVTPLGEGGTYGNFGTSRA